MVELVNRDRVIEWAIDFFNLNPGLRDKIRIIVDGNVVNFFIVGVYYYREQIPEIVKVTDIEPRKLEELKRKRSEAIDWAEDAERSILSMKGLNRLFHKNEIESYQRVSDSQRLRVQKLSNEIAKLEAETTTVYSSTRKMMNVVMPILTWDLDYDHDETMNWLNKGGLTTYDVADCILHHDGSVPDISRNPAETTQDWEMLSRAGFQMFNGTIESLFNCATTVNDNALNAFIKTFESFKDTKGFDQLVEQANKNRSDAKFKIFVALDRNYKLKLIQGTVEDLMR